MSSFGIKFVFLCLFVVLSNIVDGKALNKPIQTHLKECEDKVEDNDKGNNAYLGDHDEYCCFVPPSYSVGGDCNITDPTTTKRKKCALKSFSSIPNGSKTGCKLWYCEYDDMEFEEGYEHEKIQNGTLTSNQECYCDENRYLTLKKTYHDYAKATCEAVEPCKPGEEQTKKATKYENNICTNCKDGHFKNISGPGRCTKWRRCQYGVVQQGNRTHDNICKRNEPDATTTAVVVKKTTTAIESSTSKNSYNLTVPVVIILLAVVLVVLYLGWGKLKRCFGCMEAASQLETAGSTTTEKLGESYSSCLQSSTDSSRKQKPNTCEESPLLNHEQKSILNKAIPTGCNGGQENNNRWSIDDNAANNSRQDTEVNTNAPSAMGNEDITKFKQKNNEIYKNVKLEGTEYAFTILRQIGIACDLLDDQISDVLDTTDTNADKFSKILMLIQQYKGDYFTPEKFIGCLEKINPKPQRLIDFIQNQIDAYDRNNRNLNN